MRQEPRNPYLESDLLDLHDLLMKRARELGERVKRTPQQREELVRDTTWLLCAAANAIDASEYMPGHPEHSSAHDRKALPSAFMEWHLAHVRNSRWRTYLRAADFMLGKNRNAWREDVRIEGMKPDDLAARDDDGLAAVLAELAKLPYWGYRRRVK
ncbi:hypothetical protein J5226_21205 [Lysobacter sp. K5869]|uniref:hypothetical protein n=1 Tax=Lysobacter sp. K5869 TaxID=2820808 RepID=UPI001C062CBD|nr:hypothetical protein [Lysobacter sp. K5869]QWP76085.1 hypothetical protein J5226_21205 [Lysobacter sp. K5869]